MTSDCRDGERIERDAVKKVIEDHSLSLCHHFEEKSPS